MDSFFFIVKSFFFPVNWRSVRRALLFVFVCMAVFAVLSPRVHFAAGNFVFGSGPQALYNVTLAQHLYWYAANPLVGKPVPYAHYQLSRTYFIKGDFSRAVSEALLELEAYPAHTRTYYILGLTYAYAGNRAAAIDAFSVFIAVEPTSWAARNDKAWLQFQEGDVRGALATIEPVSNLENPWVQNTYGTLLINIGAFAEAQAALAVAERTAEALTPAEWGAAYPGNDPRVYAEGLAAMRRSIADNQALLENRAVQPAASSTAPALLEGGSTERALY